MCTTRIEGTARNGRSTARVSEHDRCDEREGERTAHSRLPRTYSFVTVTVTEPLLRLL
jgi:hypothetical protein